MILTRAVKVKIDVTFKDLKDTFSAFTDAFNLICERGWSDQDFNGVSLHHKTYTECRKLLPSQLSVSARMKATEALKSAKSRIKSGKKASCPKSKMSSIRLDANSYSVWFDRGQVSFSTTNGRKKARIEVPECFERYLSWRRKSADLFVRKNKVFLTIIFEKETDDPVRSESVIGVDRGITNIAVTSSNQFSGGGKVKRVVRRYRRLRSKLQSVGTKSAKRHLRKISSKENRFRRDVNHCVSKRIVGSVEPGTTIVLENLKNIRESAKKFRREQKFWINGWGFFQLETFLRYKAEGKGCFVDLVDARYTSQKCSRCGHVERGNRTKQSLFKCKHCGLQLNADLNAARNIAKNYQDAKSHLGRAVVNQPIVSAPLGLGTSPGARPRGN